MWMMRCERGGGGYSVVGGVLGGGGGGWGNSLGNEILLGLRLCMNFSAGNSLCKNIFLAVSLGRNIKQLLGFSVTSFKIDPNENQKRSID